MIVVALILTIPLARRLRRGLRALQSSQAPELRAIRAELDRWQRLGRERRYASSPHLRAWRYYRHPLTAALIVSYRRRRQGVR